MSAHLPGVMEPMSSPTPKYVAALMVHIWMATTGSSPSLTASRRTRSMWPSATMVCGWESSVHSMQWLVSTPLWTSCGR